MDRENIERVIAETERRNDLLAYAQIQRVFDFLGTDPEVDEEIAKNSAWIKDARAFLNSNPQRSNTKGWGESWEGNWRGRWRAGWT